MRWGVRHDPRYKSGAKAIKRDKTLTKVDKKKQLLDLKVDVSKKRYKSGVMPHLGKNNSKILTENAHRRIQGDSKGKTLAKWLLMGSYGSMEYDRSRGNENGRIKSLVNGYSNFVMNKVTFNAPSMYAGHKQRKETGRSLRRLGN